jgi:hypothetical protein
MARVFSTDIDIFHDREEAVALASSADATLLAEHGYGVGWLRREPGCGVWAAVAKDPGSSPESLITEIPATLPRRRLRGFGFDRTG